MKKTTCFLAALITAIFLFSVEKSWTQIIMGPNMDPVNTIVCPNKNDSYQLHNSYWQTSGVYTWTVTNGLFFGNTTTKTIAAMESVNVTWNSPSANSNTGTLCVSGPGISNFCQTFKILSVKDYQVPKVYVNGNEFTSASYTIQNNSFTIGVVNNSGTNFYYPNAPQQDETILSSFQWVLPSGMTGDGQSGTFTGNKIITIDASNFTGSGVIKVRPINHRCTATNDYFGVYKDIIVYKAINVTLSGPSTLCSKGTYTLSSGTATSWSVSPSSAFTVTASNAASATVTPLSLLGQSGTLTANVNGVNITKAIQACVVEITGPGTFCSTGVYTLSAGTATSWSLDPLISVIPMGLTSIWRMSLDYNSTSATVTRSMWDWDTGGMLTAVVGGVNVTKLIHSYCPPAITGPEPVPGNSRAFTYSAKHLPAGSSNFRWLFRGAHCMQIGLLPTGVSSTLSAATVTFCDNSDLCPPMTLIFSYVTTVDGVAVTHQLSTIIDIDVSSPIEENTAVPTINGIYNENGQPVTSGFVGSAFTFEANSVAAEDYKWTYTLQASPNISTEVMGFSPTVVFPSVGTYTISVQSFIGCSWSDPSASIAFTVHDLYTVYPNPVSGILYLTRNAGAPPFTNPSGQLQLMSISSGAIVVNASFSLNNDFYIDLSSVDPGTYLLRLLDSSGLLLQQKTIVKN
jgi:hypothetical protein